MQPQENLQRVRTLCAKLPQARPQLVVLPEAFSCFGGGDKQQLAVAEALGDGPIQQALSEIAQEFDIWLCAGTVPIKTGDKFYAASLLYDAAGEQVAQYNKIHLFDVEVADNTKRYLESAVTEPGQQLVVVDSPFGQLGMAVCYDVRFPELFRALREQGAEIILLPSAFTRVTGAAHWHVLTRARAIEQQCYVIAAGQYGVHENGRETYGHSLIVSPWGQVLAEQAHGEGVISTAVDSDELASIRRRMPVNSHNRFKVTQQHE